MRLSRSCLVSLVVVGCKSPEQQMMSDDIKEVEAGLAARDEAKVLIGCVGTKSGSMSRLSASDAEHYKQLCYLEAPKMFLEKAIADARKNAAEHPDLASLNCYQLFAEDAFKTLSAHPSGDVALKKLADEYTQLCPESVARFAGRDGGRK